MRIRSRLHLSLIVLWIFCGGAVSRSAEKAADAPTTPLVVIDIGHTVRRYGALSASGEGEFFFNQRIAFLLEQRLISGKKISAVVINRAGADITLTDRVELASTTGANLLVSIHHDSVQPQFLKSWTTPKGSAGHYCDDYAGFSVFVSALSPKVSHSIEAAGSVGRELVKRDFVPSTFHADPIPNEGHAAIDASVGVYGHDQLAVLRCSTSPSILIECGVIVNRDEEMRLKSVETQRALAEAIASGIEAYFAELTKSP